MIALAAGGRRGRDAHVDVLAGHLAPDPAVLRQPLLGDVEPGHDLDAGDDRRLELLGRALGLAQHAVDPVADDDVASRRARCGYPTRAPWRPGTSAS